MNAPIQPAQSFPMSFGQILDRIYRLMRAHFKLFIGIAMVPVGACFLSIALVLAIALPIVLAHPHSQPDPATFLYILIPAMIVIMVLNFAAFAIYVAASVYAAMQADVGVTVTVGEAYAVARRQAGRYLWLMFLAYLISFLPSLVIELAIAIPMMVFAHEKTTPPTEIFFLLPLAVLLFLGAFVYGVIIALRLSLAFPASVDEGLTAWEAIRRSGQLTKGAKGRIFLVLLIIYAFGYVAELAGFAVLAVVIGIGALGMAALHVQLVSIVGIIGATLAGLCFFVFISLWMGLFWSAFTTAFAVFYHDQKLRKEGMPPAIVQAGEGQA